MLDKKTLLTFSSFLFASSLLQAADHKADVIIYGGTSASVIAAVQVKKMGKSVILVSPDKLLGGLSSGGLGFTDSGKSAVVGGLSRDFYQRIYQYYQDDSVWKFQKRDDFSNVGQGHEAINDKEKTMWVFEPKAAQKVFEAYLKEFDIPLHKDAWLDRENGVKMSRQKIVFFTTLGGDTFTGDVFLDTTYEGDLMAAAGVSYAVGREGQEKYDEKWAGVQAGVFHHRHNFHRLNVDPYLVPGDPDSGVLPLISAEPLGKQGSGDKKVQAYNFRMTLTNVPENRIPFTAPEGYDEKNYELLGRVFDAGWKDAKAKFDSIPNGKTDTNNNGPVSTDFIGANYDYPEASYEQRREIVEAHKNYTMGLFYYTMTSERVPKDLRDWMAQWGLSKDEFQDTNNWSPWLYIREARRMIGSFVMTENELTQKKPTPDSVGMGSYTIDSHNVQRYLSTDGQVHNEGDIGVKVKPYKIAYGSLIPQKGECENLLVTCAVSASHVAYGSIRMEPVFMILGQSAGTAAVIAHEKNISVQEVPYAELKKQLLKDGQILDYLDRVK